mgnify:CR=1 FL=1
MRQVVLTNYQTKFYKHNIKRERKCWKKGEMLLFLLPFYIIRWIRADVLKISLNKCISEEIPEHGIDSNPYNNGIIQRGSRTTIIFT